MSSEDDFIPEAEFPETELEDGEERSGNTTPTPNRKLTSKSWQYFSVKDRRGRVAECKLCGQECSYRTSVTNLMRHIHSMHTKDVVNGDGNLSAECDRKIYTSSSSRRFTGKCWQYFSVKDMAERTATCKYCGQECSFKTSVTNLMMHVNRKHKDELDNETDMEINYENIEKLNEDELDDDDRMDNDEFTNDNDSLLVSDTSNKHKGNPIWAYFKIIDDHKKIARCLICHKRFSYRTTVTNLKKHLFRKHPMVNFDKKTIILSTGDQIYELDTNMKCELENGDCNQLTQTADVLDETIYLNEFNEIEEEKNHIETLKKKLNFDADLNPNKNKHKRIRLASHESSSDGEVQFRKRSMKKDTDSIDYFGKYLVSLLKQLPQELSNELQADMVKQVMKAQLTYQRNSAKATLKSNEYSITLAGVSNSEQSSTVNHLTPQNDEVDNDL